MTTDVLEKQPEVQLGGLQMHELLDRYELLYPEVEELSDLRRAIIDRDLSSIFRLCGDTDSDFRSAVLDDNVRSIFRCLEKFEVDLHEEFRKAVVEQNMRSVFRLFAHYADPKRTDHWHIDDLKRATLENNLYSLFRLFPEDSAEIDMLRTAIVNKNIRSICRILGNDDLGKLIMDQNVYKLPVILDKYVKTQFTTAFKAFFANETSIDGDCFSRGQLLSKQWLVRELETLNMPLGMAYLCAGWYGTLATMLFESNIDVDKIRSFDIDPEVADIAKTFNKPWVMDKWQFQAATMDIHDIDFQSNTYTVTRSNGTTCSQTDVPDTIINTSCEHIERFEDWYAKIPPGKLVILQSNNFREVEEHVNCVDSLFDFKRLAHMNILLYEGVLDLGKYKRFMLIGRK